MIANSAFLAAMVLILVLFWVMGEAQFLAVYKHVIFPQYLWTIVGAVVLVFLNLFGCIYQITPSSTHSRWPSLVLKLLLAYRSMSA